MSPVLQYYIGRKLAENRRISNLKYGAFSLIMLKGEIIGILYLDNNLVSGLFKDEDIRIIGLLMSQAGVFIEIPLFEEINFNPDPKGLQFHKARTNEDLKHN